MSVGGDLWRTHFCVPRRDFLDASAGIDTSVDAARNVRAPQIVAVCARRLGSFGRRHGLSLGEVTVKDLLRESRA